MTRLISGRASFTILAQVYIGGSIKPEKEPWVNANSEVLTANGREWTRILGVDDTFPFQFGPLEIQDDTDLEAGGLQLEIDRVRTANGREWDGKCCMAHLDYR